MGPAMYQGMCTKWTLESQQKANEQSDSAEVRELAKKIKGIVKPPTTNMQEIKVSSLAGS